MYIDPNSSAYPSVMGDVGLTKFEFAVIEIVKGLSGNPSYRNSNKVEIVDDAILQAKAIVDGINNFWDAERENLSAEMKQFLQ